MQPFHYIFPELQWYHLGFIQADDAIEIIVPKHCSKQRLGPSKKGEKPRYTWKPEMHRHWLFTRPASIPAGLAGFCVAGLTLFVTLTLGFCNMSGRRGTYGSGLAPWSPLETSRFLATVSVMRFVTFWHTAPSHTSNPKTTLWHTTPSHTICPPRTHTHIYTTFCQTHTHTTLSHIFFQHGWKLCSTGLETWLAVGKSGKFYATV